MHFLTVQPPSGKNRLPMKKSNVRFFHGEPVFSGERPPCFPNGQKCINMHSPDHPFSPLTSKNHIWCNWCKYSPTRTRV